MHTTQANLHWRGNVLSEYVLPCTQPWGWGSDNPTCKTTAAKFTKCLEFRSVSHLSLAQTNQRQPLCICADGRSPQLLFVPRQDNASKEKKNISSVRVAFTALSDSRSYIIFRDE